MKEIVLDAPGKNALSTELMERLISEFKSAEDTPILLSGANGCFSAGLNLFEVVSLDGDGMGSFLQCLTELCRTIWLHPAPVVALVEGHAIAGGCVVVQCCDVRIAQAGDKARYGLNETALGLRIPPTVLAMMRDRIPRLSHEEVLLGAGLHNAADALRLGLFDLVAENAREVASQKLQALAAHPKHAYRAMKHDLRAHVHATPEQETAFLKHAIPAWTAPEFKAKIQRMLKR